MTAKKNKLTFEQMFVKALKKSSREEYGIQPTVVRRNRKKYFRAESKRALRNLDY